MYKQGKPKTRAEIKLLLNHYLHGDRSKSEISAERFVGMIAALFHVIGYDPSNAHHLAETLTHEKQKPPRERLQRLLQVEKILNRETFA